MKKLTLLGAGVALALMMVVMPSPASAATSIADLLKQIAALQEQIKALQGQKQELRAEIKAGLKEGMTDEDIKEIQELLASDPDIYPRGIISGYFGPLTKEALKKFQAKIGLGVSGEVDEDTREYLEELLGERFGGRIPPGLLRAPGIWKKIEDRLHARCTDKVHGAGPFCKKRMVGHEEHGDNDEDDANDDADQNNEPVEEVRVEINQHDSDVEVEYEDGDVDAFSVSATNEDALVKKIAARTGLSESDVEDALTITSDNSKDESDIKSIAVVIDEHDQDSEATVTYKDGDKDSFSFDLDDEDEIIAKLADELDMDENDIESLTDFDTV